MQFTTIELQVITNSSSKILPKVGTDVGVVRNFTEGKKYDYQAKPL